jgi:hypothetical protein
LSRRENLSAIGLNCSNGYNISTGETVNGVSLSEASINGQEYYEAEGISGTGGIEVKAASSGSGGSGGGGGGSTGGSDDTGNALVVFGTPRFKMVSGTKTKTVQVTNKADMEETVTVSVPDTPSCKPVKIREHLNNGSYVKQASYTLPAGATEEAWVQVSMPRNASSFECTPDTVASQGSAGEFTVVVEHQSNPFAFLDNGPSFPWCRETSFDALKQGDCDKEMVQVKNSWLLGIVLLLFVSGVAYKTW